MKIERITINSFNEFIKKTYSDEGELKGINEGYIFRGEPRNDYLLVPTALRSELKEKLWGESGMPINNQSEWEVCQVHAERKQLINFFKRSNNKGLKVPNVEEIYRDYSDIFDTGFMIKNTGNIKWISEELEVLAALAQHHGITTRLLDWSFNINVAIYFASIGAIKSIVDKNNTNTFVIWALNNQ